jgi:hypothetical protein
LDREGGESGRFGWHLLIPGGDTLHTPLRSYVGGVNRVFTGVLERLMNPGNPGLPLVPYEPYASIRVGRSGEHFVSSMRNEPTLNG